MARYIQNKRTGKLAGSIGDGKHQLPNTLEHPTVPGSTSDAAASPSVEQMFERWTSKHDQGHPLITADTHALEQISDDFAASSLHDAKSARIQARQVHRLSSEFAKATVDGDGAVAAELRNQFGELVGHLPTDAPFTEFEALDPVAPEDLPHGPGIYVITGADAHYVGLSNDIHTRFHNRDFGHLQPSNKCRSQYIISTGEYEIRVIDVPGDPADPNYKYALATAEIRTFARLAATGKYVNNAISALGKVGNSSGAPVITCNLETGEYRFYESVAAASRNLGTSSPTALHGYHRTSQGHAVRWASPSEQEALLEHLDRRGRVTGEDVKKTVSREAPVLHTTGEGRTAKVNWAGGLLADEDRSSLGKYTRGSYNKELPPSGYAAVSYNTASNKWQARIKTGPGAKEFTSKYFSSPSEAAAWREREIAARNLQSFNIGRYSSNAEKAGRQQFPGWNGDNPRAA